MRIPLLALLACGGKGPSLPECETACPDGTRRASFSDVNLVSTETLVISEATCETVCEPVTPCCALNVPRPCPG